VSVKAIASAPVRGPRPKARMKISDQISMSMPRRKSNNRRVPNRRSMDGVKFRAARKASGRPKTRGRQRAEHRHHDGFEQGDEDLAVLPVRVVQKLMQDERQVRVRRVDPLHWRAQSAQSWPKDSCRRARNGTGTRNSPSRRNSCAPRSWCGSPGPGGRASGGRRISSGSSLTPVRHGPRRIVRSHACVGRGDRLIRP
jgi:hypothetical protein